MANDIDGRVNPATHAESASLDIDVDVSMISTQPFYPDNFTARLHSFLTHKDPGKQIYALSQMPHLATCNWRGRTNFAKETTILACRGAQFPLKLWIVGELVTAYFFEQNSSDPLKRVNLYIRPLLPTDMSTAERLLHMFVSVEGDQPTLRDTVKVGRWQTQRKRGSTETTATPFTILYDATTTFCAKDQMTTLDPSQLGRGDVLLAEVEVVRYHPMDADNHSPDLSKWEIRFDIQALSLLLQAPEEYNDVVDNRESNVEI
ncbi:hypothetical protein NEOLEDRAFT_1184021 [Neolentinus lepideus HHB14362 ss-1]|uniref:Uncharacterized protein n=1 Tax=Neolentinus lepideus HHB14362 ss-1 TaxID=1314782 RepID=A0A165MTG1_9AGAM|nr:hypothetical protein NEOLEDRAFT_1184021 [Neolentinus lepideus HHB14362 ss-1]